MRIGYIVHDLNDGAVIRRLRMLEAGGAKVDLAGFRRSEMLEPLVAARHPVDLGRTADAALARRAGTVLAASLLSGRLVESFRRADLILARNLETLAVARRIVGKRPLAYECLDLHRSLTSTGPGARAVQAVEAALLPRVDLLVTSSPAFVRVHFANRRQLTAPTLLVENKLLVLDADPPAEGDAPPSPPFVIGWFGMLRCRRTLTELSALARRMKGRIEVLIAGRPSAAEFPDWDEDVAAVPHLRYVGPYHAADLPALYAQCHFAWTIDWFEEGRNSSWLLPNRLYEAQAFGVVPIVDANVEVGYWLAAANAGLRLTGGTDELAQVLNRLDDEGYNGLRAAVAAIPRERLIATNDDARALVAHLERVTHG